MKDLKNEHKRIFTIDIPKCEIESKISLVGFVLDKKDFANSRYGIKVRDITGTIWCTTTDRTIYSSVTKNKRVNVLGSIILNSQGNKVISITNINVLVTQNTEFSLLDSEMQEQSARMLMARILKTTSALLQKQGYIEFESKLISRQLSGDNSLEPLLVKYSGFGTPAQLIISPSAQVIEFLETTLSTKCFTISTSFTASYRLPNTPSELKVIMAKSLNLSEDEHKKLMIDILVKNLSEIKNNGEQVNIKEYSGTWSEKVENEPYLEKVFEVEINLVCFDSNIPIVGNHWNTVIKRIYHLLDKEKNIIIEGAREYISEESIICTTTFYPSQFLCLIKNASARQIKNLDKLFYGYNT